ncbi:hypothetical protein ACFP82_17620 [Cellulomonas gelida]
MSLPLGWVSVTRATTWNVAEPAAGRYRAEPIVSPMVHAGWPGSG